jgi:hypothetical protein
MPANAECRKKYSKDMCGRSLEILNRTVMIAMHPLHTDQDIDDMIHNIGTAAQVSLGGLAPDQARIRNAQPIEEQKFDLQARP